VKELRLPKELAIRFYLEGQPPAVIAPEASFSNALEVIEKNGAELIAATVMLEDRMIEAVGKLLFPKSADSQLQRDFFTEEIIGTSDFSFAFKRKVLTRLLERTKTIDAERINELKAGLNKIMEWRNAFAHGKIVHEHNGGFFLAYYSGGRKELVLDDEYFEKVESTFRKCLYQCNGIVGSA
jgi:hypothetical protein